MALRFYLTILPALAFGVLVGFGIIHFLDNYRVGFIGGGAIGVLGAWMAYGPLQKLETEIKPQIEANIGRGFDIAATDTIPAALNVDRFRELDLLYPIPGEISHAFADTNRTSRFAYLKASFEYPTQRRGLIEPRLTNFSGALIRIALEKRPSSTVILTRDKTWFADMSTAGTSYSAGPRKLVTLSDESGDLVFQAFADSQAAADAVVSSRLMTGLAQLETSFVRRPVRLAIVPEGKAGAVYAAVETSGLFEGFTLLEGLVQRQRYDSLVQEMAGIRDLVDLVIHELDHGG